MFNQNQNKIMYYKSLFNDVDSIFDVTPSYWINSKLSSNVLYKVEKDKLEIAISVLGHDPKNVEVELTTDKIFVKAEKNKEDKSLKNSFLSDVSETLKLHSDFDGLTANAKIENGILHIVVEKKEESKPKKLSIKF
jgi:HSP20 family molecular chaperone IbpA